MFLGRRFYLLRVLHEMGFNRKKKDGKKIGRTDILEQGHTYVLTAYFETQMRTKHCRNMGERTSHKRVHMD